MSDQLTDYRNHLVLAEQKAQESFDKTVVSLSSGALGISLAFYQGLAGEEPLRAAGVLTIAWCAWALSAIVILVSYFTSHQALRKAIRQVDAKTIYEARPGGRFDKITAWCNAAGLVLFLIGLIAFLTFAAKNLEVL